MAISLTRRSAPGLTPAAIVVCLTAATTTGQAQVPAGAVAGVVTDASGSRLSGVQVQIVNRETGQSRQTTASEHGEYLVPLLQPGEYEVTAVAAGFKPLVRKVVVETGTTTAVDLMLQLGELSDTVSVRAALPLIRYDHHGVEGVVAREQIENVPLNGRNLLELAKLEPGVTTPVVQPATNRTFVPALGAGLPFIPRIGVTRTTVDGASINAVLTFGTSMQVSPEVVQEFQMSTVDFDVSTGPATAAAVNIVTRSGANAFRGSVFSFYRDHNLAAHPDLRRDPANQDPFFQRTQLGATLGGPILKDRSFFFSSYEHNDQRGAVSIRPNDPEFGALGGIFPSPYLGNLFSARIDGRWDPRHSGFVRYTHDGSRSFGGINAQQLVMPSGWPRGTAGVDQGLVALTSVLSPTAVNDVRISYFSVRLSLSPARSEDCPGCFGLGMPRILVEGAGLTFGNSRDLNFTGRRVQVTDSFIWQKGRHQFRAGVDWEHATTAASTFVPPEIRLWSPSQVRARTPAIPLPAAFATVDDVLALPLRGFTIDVGASTTLERGFRPDRVADLIRLHAGDTWRPHDRLTFNGGLGWSYEPNALNHDLTKPLLLAPIVGDAGLTAPRVQRANFAPVLGIAWTASKDGRTVVRGGAGRYFDPAAAANSTNLANERQLLSPLGTGQFTVTGSNVFWDGRVMDFPQPAAFTGRHLLPILQQLRAALAGQLNPDNRDFSVRNLDLTKEGTNLSDPGNRTPYAIHVNLGVQREVVHGVVVSGDLVWKHFVHTPVNGIDYNRFNSAAGPILRRCAPDERHVVLVPCSNGPIMFDTTIGRARYKGLLVRAHARFTGSNRLLASYALGSYVGTNGTGAGTAEGTGGRVFGFNTDDWFENYGPLPTDRRHVLNLSGSVALPWRLQLAFSISAYSRTPLSVYLSGMDFNGDGTRNDLLPGSRVGQFGRSLDRVDLKRLVDVYNQTWAGRPTPTGVIAPPVELPAEYDFDDSFFTQDVRVTRAFALGGQGVRLDLLGEVFNLLNTPNLVGYTGNLASPGFGRPTGRFTNIFGSGGPRAFQLGARLSF